MPELPEVETIRKDLMKNIQDKKILNIFISSKASINKDEKYFSDFLRAKQIKNIDRIGKLLIFDFGFSEFLLIHLKMTGQLIYQNKDKIIGGGHSDKQINFNLPDASTRIIFEFSDNSKLFFNDFRRFGYFKLVSLEEMIQEKNKYGIEPLQANFTWENFQNIFKNKNTNLKAFLLNQANISGLGNIYVDESCFEAKIRPDKKVAKLSLEEKERLFKAIQKIIKKACDYRGTTFNNYLDSDGNRGNFSNFLQVYGRTGEKCFHCSSDLKTIKLAGRTTVFCPFCQK